MAIIDKVESTSGPVTGWDIENLCPAGAHVAVCLDIKDSFDVTRPKYEDKTQSEVVNLTRFLFGIKGPDDNKYRVQTHDLKISGHEKAALVGFLTSWLAKPLDALFGWDYVEQIGKPAMLTIIHKTSLRGTVYAIIQSITPLLDQLMSQVPSFAEFPSDGQSLNKTLAENTAEPVPVSPVVQQAIQPTTETTADNATTIDEDDVPF